MLPCNTLVNLVAIVAACCGVSAASSDPATADYSVKLFAFGDWGASLDHASCCSGPHVNYDLQAQKTVAVLMDLKAKEEGSPDAMVSHGDHFYWTGIDSKESSKARFKASFEDVYDGDYIKNVTVLGTSGNHDKGGANYICNHGDELAACKDPADLLQGVQNKFDYQARYKSPNNNRWRMDAEYFTYVVKNPTTGVSIEVFNVDTNDADVAGMHGVCCQCYGYAGNDNAGCNSIQRGDKYCCGGNNDMYDACIKHFKEVGELSRKQLAKDAAASDANFKYVNTHFSFTQHFEQEGMNKWIAALRNFGVQLYGYGHTHGEKHDYSDSLRLHLVENGAGGGAKKEAASTIPERAASFVKNIWAYSGNEYGFMSMKVSPEWLKLEYHTAGDDWVFAETFAATKIGSVATKHCWYIPRDGSKGRAC